jgi:hypothetical protein
MMAADVISLHRVKGNKSATASSYTDTSCRNDDSHNQPTQSCHVLLILAPLTATAAATIA